MMFSVGDRVIIPEQESKTLPGRKYPPRSGVIMDIEDENGALYAEVRLDDGSYIISAPVDELEVGA